MSAIWRPGQPAIFDDRATRRGVTSNCPFQRSDGIIYLRREHRMICTCFSCGRGRRHRSMSTTGRSATGHGLKHSPIGSIHTHRYFDSMQTWRAAKQETNLGAYASAVIKRCCMTHCHVSSRSYRLDGLCGLLLAKHQSWASVANRPERDTAKCEQPTSQCRRRTLPKSDIVLYRIRISVVPTEQTPARL